MRQTPSNPSVETAHPLAAPAAPAVQFLDRDQSILAFNERVLDWARRPDVPLLERLRFLCIVSSNLDEFFEVRAALHLTAAVHQEPKAGYSANPFRPCRLQCMTWWSGSMRCTTTP